MSLPARKNANAVKIGLRYAIVQFLNLGLNLASNYQHIPSHNLMNEMKHV